MKLLIDGDGPLYRAAAAAQSRTYYVYPKGDEDMGYLFSCKYKKDALAYCGDNVDDFIIEWELKVEPEYAAIHNIDSIMGTILSLEPNGDHEVYVGGEGNFRYDINPEYKAGRPEKPAHYDAVKRRLVERYNAVTVDGMEVDDKLSIEQWQDYIAWYNATGGDPEVGPLTCIVTLDKDLDMVPGWHYNWVKGEKYFITEEEGDVNFYIQLLTGDRTDNIHGLSGIGPVTAKKLLDGAGNPVERYKRCVDTYREAGRDDIEDVARQIWMSKNEPNDWEPPV